MPRRALLAAALLASAALTPVPADALELDDLRVDVRLIERTSKDPFRIRARLVGVDPRELVQGFVRLRFGDVRAEIPAGGFRRRGGSWVWKNYLLGVRKVTVNVKKATITAVGRDVELGDLAGPVTLAVATSRGNVCGRLTMGAARGGRASQRRSGGGPLESCVPPPGVDVTPPDVLVTRPTSLDGATTAAPTVALGGVARDDVGVAGLAWTNDRGGGGSLLPAADWTVDVPLQPGDNLLMVTATDAAGNHASDALAVTYNTNGIVFVGPPVADPDALFTNASANSTVRQTIEPNPDLDAASVQIEEIGEDGAATRTFPLKDDGFEADAGGDLIPGDNVYTGKFRIRGTSDDRVRFRVSARTLSNPAAIALSPVLDVPVVGHLSSDALVAAIGLANDARTVVTNLAAAGVTGRDALGEVLALAHAAGATATGPSHGGLGAWWITADGLLGGVLAYDTETRRGPTAAAPAARALPTVAGATTTPSPLFQVGTRRSLILAPYFADAEPLQVDGMLRASQCPQFEVTTHVGAEAGAEKFKNLEEYGIILVASHGDALFSGLGAAYRPEWAWSSQGAQQVVLTGTTLDQTNLSDWERDLRLGRMAVFPGGTAAILPTFITRYSIRLPASLVYMGSCRSAASPVMSTALMESGAATFLGWDGYVSSAFAGQVGASLFADLLQGKTVAEAFAPVSDGGAPPAHFAMAGEAEASLTADPVINGSFEITSGFAASVTGFTVNGDARIVGELGLTLPPGGGRMALVSTGLGLTKDLGSFEQPVCIPPLPPGKTRMMLYYDWNFFSEEFLEFCGSPYQDSFEVTFGATSLQSTKIDDLCAGVTPADVSFDKGDVHKTGWITQAVDVTAFAGTTDVLRFGAADVGDSIYDSVILVDRVRVVAE